MAHHTSDLSLFQRLRIKQYSRDVCLTALHGESVPYALAHPLHQICTVRGIRYHPGFGDRLYGSLPIFTRALNARKIMSEIIPDLSSPDEVAYCIWHPVTASEETYRRLAQRYPYLVYQVARACAVAGYTELYHELEVLPDVHIAEEARECGNLAMYEAIVCQPVRYTIMNDYTRTVDFDSRQPANLNGDTSVRWMLDIRQEIQDSTSDLYVDEHGDIDVDDIFDPLDSPGYEESMFNVCEDMQVDERKSTEATKRTFTTRLELQLLYEPLPADLPTVQKDILILMAAYQGNVDRFARLRRPKRIVKETACCVRGIYHNTFFAVVV